MNGFLRQKEAPSGPRSPPRGPTSQEERNASSGRSFPRQAILARARRILTRMVIACRTPCGPLALGHELPPLVGLRAERDEIREEEQAGRVDCPSSRKRTARNLAAGALAGPRKARRPSVDPGQGSRLPNYLPEVRMK